MTSRKQKSAPKLSVATQKTVPEMSSAPRIAKGTLYYRTKFVAYGDLLGWRHRIYVKIALHPDDWCMLVLEMTPLSEFGDSVFRQGLFTHDVVKLYVAGCYLNARVAAKGIDGTIYIHAQEVLRGLAGPAFVDGDRRLGNRGARHAKRKTRHASQKAQRNG
jgi:hypothetical protein